MESVFWVLVLILLALPALAILILIVLIDVLLRLVQGIVALLSRKKDHYVPSAFLEERPEQSGRRLSDNFITY